MKKGKTGSSEGTLSILREEGLRSLMNRSADRSEDGRRRRKLQELKTSGGRIVGSTGLTPALNVSAAAPFTRIDDAHLQMIDRLDFERTKRTVALAYPRDGSWWLEVWSGDLAGYLPLGRRTNLVDILADAASLIRTNVVHIEDCNGLPLSLIQGLGEKGLQTAVSIHDFIFFCRRPHLIEMPAGRFCRYSNDMNRCRACLQEIDPEGRHPQEDHRRLAAEAIYHANLVIYPSTFMQRRHQAFYPDRQPTQREVVIAPAISREPAPPAKNQNRHNVAFVGGATIQAGAFLIAPVMDQILKELPKTAGFVYGSGDSDMLQQVRQVNRVTVRGYYRKGGLPPLLSRDRIGVALLPAICPDAYNLVVDDCLSAGVPVVALNLGAVADRLNYWEVGRSVPLSEGVEGLAHAVTAVLDSEATVPSSIIKALPLIDRAAKRHIDHYRILRALALRG